MLVGYLVHSHYLASDRFVTTTEEDQEIVFPMQLNTLEITAGPTELKILFNNDSSPMYIRPLTSDGITGMPMARIIVKGPAGQMLKWRGLSTISTT